MKEFSLEEHLKNPERKIVTRDGRDARIICTDKKGCKPIVILVEEDGEEDCFPICANGRCLPYKEDCLDLFFAPEKKVGWMNLYKKSYGLVQGDLVRNSEEAAKKIAAGDEDYITTIKVEWEE